MTIPAQVLSLIERLNAGGHAAYAVGGCVRDSLMGRAPSDWDIATSATPDRMKACFAGLRTIDTGLRHGTLTVLVDGMPYEITTFRTDGEYRDHRRPDRVRFVGELRQDLARRDFTVNAMAVGPDGALIDPFQGQADLRARTLRCVGDPDARFKEDALRILRAMRFASVLGFEVETATAAAMHANRALLAHVSPERVYSELTRMLCGAGIEPVLMNGAEVLAEVVPEILPAVGFDQRNPHHDRDIWAHTAKAVSLIAPEPALRLAMLLHDLGKPRCFTVDEKGVGHFHGHAKISERIAERALGFLRADNLTKDRTLTLVRLHDMRPEPTEKWLARRLNERGERGVRDLLAVWRADAGAQSALGRGEKLALLDACGAALDAVLTKASCFSLSQLALNGADLIALGIPEGRRVGEALSWLLSRVMDGELENNRAQLERAARARYMDT